MSPPTIGTAADFLNYVYSTFPRFSKTDISRLLRIYQFDQSSVDRSAPLFDTLGDRGPTALNQSGFGTGQQQRLFNLFAESTFVCPSYWLAEAFTGKNHTWKYQYSVTPSYHGDDLNAYSVNTISPTKGFKNAFQKVYGNFIIHNNPIISIEDAKSNSTAAKVPEGRSGKITWPAYSNTSPIQLNFNTTGGTLKRVVVTENLAFFQRFDPGVSNQFRLVNAETWEGERGARCRFWRDVAPRVPR